MRTASVACGVLGVGGNKGGVAVAFSVHRRRVAAVCSHLAAHQGAAAARSSNWASIAGGLRFDARPWWELDEGGGGGGGGDRAAAAADRAAAAIRPADSDSSSDGESRDEPPPPGAGEGPGLAGCDAVLWAGDLNYRVDAEYDAAVHAITAGDWASLLPADQLAAERAAGRAFVGMAEAPLVFPPTYKFDRGAPGPAYDSSEKRRVPAWTDRVLFRSAVKEGGGGGGAAASVACTGYGCLPDVLDSDHKPVWARLALTVAAVDAAAARAAAAAALDLADAGGPPKVPGPHSLTATPPTIALHRDGAPAATVELHNASPTSLAWRAAPADGAPMPPWLDVRPVGGVLGPGERVSVAVEAAAADTFFSARPRAVALAIVAGAVAGDGEPVEARVDVALHS